MPSIIFKCHDCMRSNIGKSVTEMEITNFTDLTEAMRHSNETQHVIHLVYEDDYDED